MNCLSNTKNNTSPFKLIKSDFQIWCSWRNQNYSLKGFVNYLKYPENRIIIASRFFYDERQMFVLKLIGHILRIGTKHLNLYIWTKDVGEGMRIMHGFSTVINAQSIGKNFICSQQVTIGWGKGGEPIIGDNVTIYAGAIIVGGVRIGNNVKIGAGAIVNKDVPDNTLVVSERNRYIDKTLEYGK